MRNRSITTVSIVAVAVVAAAVVVIGVIAGVTIGMSPSS